MILYPLLLCCFVFLVITVCLYFYFSEVDASVAAAFAAVAAGSDLSVAACCCCFRYLLLCYFGFCFCCCYLPLFHCLIFVVVTVLLLAGRGGRPDTVRAYMPVLLRKKVQGVRVQEKEWDSLQSWRCVHVQTGREGGPTTDLVGHWMGMGGSTTLWMLKEMLQCEGRRCPEQVEKCGRPDGYCQGCEKQIAALGKAWHLAMMADAITQTAVVALRSWVLEEREVVFWEYRAAVHNCEELCTGPWEREG